MSMETWKAEFYPTSVKGPMTRLEAVAHSARKWNGTAPEALAKHGVEYSNFKVFERHDPISGIMFVFDFSSATCSLCEKYWTEDEDDNGETDNCGKCPFSQALGRACIDNYHDKSHDFMQSDFFASRLEPSQMRGALNELLRIETALAEETENARLDAISDAKFFADQATAAESPEEVQAIHKSIYG